MDLDLGSKRAKKLIRDHDLTEEEIYRSSPRPGSTWRRSIPNIAPMLPRSPKNCRRVARRSTAGPIVRSPQQSIHCGTFALAGRPKNVSVVTAPRSNPSIVGLR